MAKKLTNVEFISKCKETHGEKYNYSKTDYINYRTKITITCDKHGDISIFPDNHIGQKQGCSQCAREKHKLTEISKERLIRLREIHNNKYKYEDTSVINGKIKIICPNHEEFTQSIHHHENGHGCYKCEKESRVKIRTRICSSCNSEKGKSEFNKKFQICKSCQENKIIPEYKICINCNLEKSINLFTIRKDSKDNHRNECIECYQIKNSITSKIYRKKNKSILREKNKSYHKNRLSNDPLYRLKYTVKGIIRKSLSKKGYTKKSRTHEILGCSYDYFKSHIESLFLPEMDWQNRDLWHIDHIIPLSFAQTEEECLKLNHYSNLRPLWIYDNLFKSDIITETNEIYDEIIENRTRKNSYNYI